MKKRIITAFAAVLTSLCNIMPCVAAENPVVSVSSTAAKPGAVAEVTVDISGCAGFTNLALEVGYDSEVLELQSIVNNASVGRIPTTNKKKNPCIISWNGTNDVVFNGTLVTIQFKVNEGAVYRTYPITVDYYKGRNADYVDGVNCNYNTNHEPLNLQYKNGSITVTDKNIISASDISFASTKTEFSLNAVALGEFRGKLIAAFKDESGVLKAVRMYDAKQITQVSYDGACDYAEVMWWDMSLMTPIADPITLSSNVSGMEKL